MAATKATAESLLKEKYLPKIQRTLNNEALVQNLLRKGTRRVMWTGSEWKKVFHVGRNDGIAYADNSGGGLPSLPAAGAQTYLEVKGDTARMLFRFQLDGRIFDETEKGTPDEKFASVFFEEMKGLERDVKKKFNRDAVVAGDIAGIINEKATSTATTAATDVTAPAEGTLTVQYSGDFARFSTVVTATPATWIRVNLIAMDTYATIATSPSGGAVYIKGYDEAAGTITLAVIDATGAGRTISTDLADDAYGIAVQFADALYDDKDGDAFGALYNYSLQPHGLLHNICSNTLHSGITSQGSTITRDAAAAATIRSTVMTMGKQAGAGSLRQPLTVTRFHEVLDEVYDKLGEEPDLILVNSKFFSLYNDLVQTVTFGGEYKIEGKKGTADPSIGRDGMRFAGIKFMRSQEVPNGMAFILTKKDWMTLEKTPFGFRNNVTNTGVLEPRPDHDGYQGVGRWMLDFFCDQPANQAILTGFAY